MEDVYETQGSYLPNEVAMMISWKKNTFRERMTK